MCIICVEFQNQRLSFKEARRNLREMVEDIDKDHAREVEEMIEEALLAKMKIVHSEVSDNLVDLDDEALKLLYENLDDLYI